MKVILQMLIVAPRTRILASSVAMSKPDVGESRPTRVLFFNTRDHRGADVDVHLSLIRSFDARKTRAYLLSNSEAGDANAMRAVCQQLPDLTYDFLPLGMPIQKFAERGNAGRTRGAMSIAASMLRAARYVHRHRIDIIHATDRPRDAAFSTLLARLTRTPNVVHMHSNAGSHLSAASRWGLRNATALFAVSAATREEMITFGLPADNISVVHNATDPSHFDPAKMGDARALIRARLGIPVKAPVIGIVARLNPWKGQRELIEAVASLTPSHPDLHLLVLGSGEDKEQLLRNAGKLGFDKRILFLGWQDDVRPYLSAMDLFCLPSHAEPFGLAITEAMSMALPVVACHSGGVPEIITHGEHGWLVAPRSVDELQGAIQHLLAHPDCRRKLGQKARRRILEFFTPAQQSNLVSHLYEDIVRRQHSRRRKILHSRSISRF